jgi:L-ribulokinase
VSNVVAISVDTTGSTPVAVDAFGSPLALDPAFSENPNAMFILWKDHTANSEAAEINALAHRWEIDYTKYSGGTYSSEWFWAKMLHILRTDEKVGEQAFSWVEHCDWIPALLTGVTDALQIKRSRCAAGHKAMWHEEFGGLPSSKFLNSLDKRLAGIRERLYRDTFTSDQAAGRLSAEWSSRLGLPSHVKVGVGGIDAHFGAVGACIEPFRLVKVIGTSTCDMLIAPNEKYGHQLISGICGQVNGSIVPDMLGMEAGQSAFGDLYAWYREMLSFPLLSLSEFVTPEIIDKIIDGILPSLSDAASVLPVLENDIVALDWINGRRTPDANLNLTATISGIRLDSDAPHVFKALVEATAFGSRSIIAHFSKQGIPIIELIALGGIAKKSPYIMQTLANVVNMPIKVVKSEQACALGAAMFAATIGGVYPFVNAAQKAMTSGYEATYLPEKQKVAVYDKLYAHYLALGARHKVH